MWCWQKQDEIWDCSNITMRSQELRKTGWLWTMAPGNVITETWTENLLKFGVISVYLLMNFFYCNTEFLLKESTLNQTNFKDTYVMPRKHFQLCWQPKMLIFDEVFNNHISYKCCYRKTISSHNHLFFKESLDKKCWPSQLCMVVPFCKWSSKSSLQNWPRFSQVESGNCRCLLAQGFGIK